MDPGRSRRRVRGLWTYSRWDLRRHSIRTEIERDIFISHVFGEENIVILSMTVELNAMSAMDIMIMITLYLQILRIRLSQTNCLMKFAFLAVQKKLNYLVSSTGAQLQIVIGRSLIGRNWILA